MKTGKTLVELATELQRQAETKRDFVADTSLLKLHAVRGQITEPRLGVGPNETFGMNDLAHRQLGEYLKIPAAYYDRMRTERPDLLAANVNAWFEEHPKEKRMVRTLDGRARAVLSDAFRPLENLDLAEAVLPVLADLNVLVLSCEVTERRLYIKAVDKRIERDIPSGRKMGDGSHVFFDTVSPAIALSNSEVGHGALAVETAVWTKKCTNLAIAAQHSMRKYHVGARADLGAELWGMLSEKTRRVTDAALWSQVRDIVKGAFDKARFDAIVGGMKEMSAQPITGDVAAVVELTAKRFDMSDGEKGSVLKHLIEGGDLTRYGLFNAVTRTAEDLDAYDRATDFERLGGKLIELPRNEWQALAEAA